MLKDGLIMYKRSRSLSVFSPSKKKNNAEEWRRVIGTVSREGQLLRCGKRRACSQRKRRRHITRVVSEATRQVVFVCSSDLAADVFASPFRYHNFHVHYRRIRLTFIFCNFVIISSKLRTIAAARARARMSETSGRAGRSAGG